MDDREALRASDLITRALDALRLMETGEGILWCEEHNERGYAPEVNGRVDSHCWVRDMGPTPCRMVAAVLMLEGEGSEARSPLPDVPPCHRTSESLMETGEKGEWCIAHKSSNWSRSSVCDVVALMLAQGQMPSPCRMVEGVLTIREGQ